MAILFRHGDLRVGKEVYHDIIRKYRLLSRGEERGPVLTSRDDSSLVMASCAMKPEDKTQPSYIFTLSSRRERSSLPPGFWVPC